MFAVYSFRLANAGLLTFFVPVVTVASSTLPAEAGVSNHNVS